MLLTESADSDVTPDVTSLNAEADDAADIDNGTLRACRLLHIIARVRCVTNIALCELVCVIQCYVVIQCLIVCYS